MVSGSNCDMLFHRNMLLYNARLLIRPSLAAIIYKALRKLIKIPVLRPVIWWWLRTPSYDIIVFKEVHINVHVACAPTVHIRQ